MPNIGDIIRASDVAIPAGSVIPFYNVTLSGRYPIFWGKTEADTGWLVCDGGDDLHGGTVPDLTNKFIMGVVSVDEANIMGGSTTTSSSTIGGNIDSTTLSTSTMPSHTHSYKDYYGYSGGDLLTYGPVKGLGMLHLGQELAIPQEVLVHILIVYLQHRTLTQ